MGKYIMTAEHKAAIGKGVKKYHTKCKLGKQIIKIYRARDERSKTKKDRRAGPRPITPQL